VPPAVFAARDKGEFRTAADLLKTELASCERTFKPGGVQCFEVTLELAYMQAHVDRQAAVGTAERAISIARANPAIPAYRLADALVLLGDVADVYGSFEIRQYNYDQAWKIAFPLMSERPDWAVIVATRLADMQRLTGDYEKEERTLRAIIAQLERGPGSSELGLAVSKLAANQAYQGKWVAAADLAGRGVRLLEQFPPEDLTSRVRARIAWAHALWITGALGQTGGVLQDAVEDAKRLPDQMSVVLVMSDMSRLFVMIKPSNAVDYAMTAIRIYEEQKLDDPSVRISLGIILANARWANGDEAGARVTTRETYALMRASKDDPTCDSLPFEIGYFRIVALDGDLGASEAGLADLTRRVCGGIHSIDLWATLGDVASRSPARRAAARYYYRRATELSRTGSFAAEQKPGQYARIYKKQVAVAWQLKR
jgi:ATP/maltotriose-dependent transcriptional regulator MalT